MTAFLSIADKRHIEEAAADPAVRSSLLSDPRNIMERILGRPLGDVGIRLHEEPAGAMYFALPAPGQGGAVPEARTRRQFFENMLFEMAERSPALLRQAEADPRRMFFELTGNDVDLPPGHQPVIFADGPSEIHVVLPQPSESIEDELPDDLLEFVAGGAPSPCNSRAGENKSSVAAGLDKLAL